METVRYDVSGWGTGALVLDGDVVLHHELPRPGGRPPAGEPLSGLAADLVARVRRLLAGAPVEFADVRIDLEGLTPLGVALVEALRGVPWGDVVTYGELAALAGRPHAPRAAGAVCAGNRFALIVPCHRVVAAGGIGGYGAAGVELKRRLLELEGVEL